MENKFRLWNRLHYKSAERLEARGEFLLSVWHNPVPGMDVRESVLLECDQVGVCAEQLPWAALSKLRNDGGLDIPVKNKATAGGKI